MTIQKTLITADELFMMPDDGQRHELVEGELRTMSPAGGEHGVVAARFLIVIDRHVQAGNLGYTFAAETGFKIARDPDTVRAPDVAFVAASRFAGGQLPKNFPELAPDLVVEVVSPGDRAEEVEEKLHDWLRAGVRLVLVAYPSTRSVTAYRSTTEVTVLREVDELDADDVLPGFRCAVRDLFPA